MARGGSGPGSGGSSGSGNGNVVNRTGTTSDSYRTLFDISQADGLVGIGSIENTLGVNEMTVRETVTDKFGVTTVVETVIPVDGNYLLDPQTNFDDGVGSLSLPPYVNYKVEVKSTVNSAPTDYELHYSDVAPGSSGSSGGGPATQIIETSGPTTLDIDAIPDGTFLKRVGATIVGAAPDPGDFVLIETKTLVAEADTVTFSGLNGDVDGRYLLLAEVKTGSGGAGSFEIQFNGIATDLQYIAEAITSTSAFFGGGAGGTVGQFANVGGMSRVDIRPRTGFPRRATGYGHSDDAGGAMSSGGLGFVTWNETVTNITSLVFKANGANKFGIGSIFSLYRISE